MRSAPSRTTQPAGSRLPGGPVSPGFLVSAGTTTTRRPYGAESSEIMGFRDEFSERGPALVGLEGDRWKDEKVGDFIRGRVVRALVQDGQTMTGESEKKMTAVLSNIVGRTGGESIAAPMACIVASKGRGSALAEALDAAVEGSTVQVAFVATKPGATTGMAKQWTVKVWAPDSEPGKSEPVKSVDMRTWGAKQTPSWTAPDGKVVAL